MSLWIPRRDAQGRLHFYTVNIPLQLVLVVPAICLAFLLGLASTAALEALAVSTGMLLLGFAFFLRAKISVYHSGFWFSFGSGRMSVRMRRYYRLGYLLLIPAALMTFVLSLLVIRIHG